MNFDSIKKEKDSAVSKSPEVSDENVDSQKGTLRKPKIFKVPKGRGLIYIRHIPHGFYEDQMKAYFNQFGTVTATAVARSRKTGRSKGYGFVEFKDAEVAKIAAATMNNYLMFNKIIKCKYIPPEERRTRIKSGMSTASYARKKNRVLAMKNNKTAMAGLDQNTYIKKVQKKVQEFKKHFEDIGVEFTFEAGNAAVQDDKKGAEVKSEDEPENEYGVLEIDESDKEITFKTPPQVQKIVKKSQSSPETLSKASQTKKDVKPNQLKKKKSKQTGAKERQVQKSDGNLDKTRQKLERKVKSKLTSTELAKAKPISKNNIKAVVKEKNLKVKSGMALKQKMEKDCIPKIDPRKFKKTDKKINANAKN